MDKSGKWRGRFFVERIDDYWQVVDDIQSTAIGANTKKEALDMAKFCRDYVRKWGCINFDSFPYSWDDEPNEVEIDEGEPYELSNKKGFNHRLGAHR
jgi:hypothetical protein